MRPEDELAAYNEKKRRDRTYQELLDKWERELQTREMLDHAGAGQAQPMSETQRRRQEGAARQYARRNFLPYGYSVSWANAEAE